MEVTDVEGIYAKAADMMGELRVLKEEKTRTYTEEGQEHPELVYAFLSVVNLATQSSVLLLCGGREVALAKEVSTSLQANLLAGLQYVLTPMAACCRPLAARCPRRRGWTPRASSSLPPRPTSRSRRP